LTVLDDELVLFDESLNLILRQAAGDTGGSKRCAAFLLSLWNGSYFKVDLQDLLYIDTDLHEAMLRIFNHLHITRNQLATYVTKQQIEPIVDMWGETFRVKKKN